MTVLLLIRSYRDREPVVAILPSMERAMENLGVILQAEGITIREIPYHLALRDGHISLLKVTVPTPQ